MKELRCKGCERTFKSSEALDMHNQHKHAQVHPKLRLSPKRKRQIRNYGFVFFVIILVVGFFYWWLTPPEDAPIMEISSENYMFGTVSQAKGTVDGELTITNAGKTDLIINKMDTSCGCTSAAIVSDGIEGPLFGMANHGTNPKNWQIVIPPGKSAQLKIYYNPNVHRGLRGPLTRSVFIYSNDPGNRKKEVRISATQTD